MCHCSKYFDHTHMLGTSRYIIFTSSAPGYVFQEENVFLVSYKWERVGIQCSG